MEPVLAAATTVDVDEIVLEALGFNDFVRDLQEAINEMAAADAAKEAALETGFNGFAGELEEAMDGIPADKADVLAVLVTLRELGEATDKMVMAASAGEDFVRDLGIADFAREFLETINEIATAVAAGEAVLEVGLADYYRKLKEVITDFTHELKDAIGEMATTDAANEAVLEALARDLEEAMDDQIMAAADVADDAALAIQTIDGEASLDAST